MRPMGRTGLQVPVLCFGECGKPALSAWEVLAMIGRTAPSYAMPITPIGAPDPLRLASI